MFMVATQLCFWVGNVLFTVFCGGGGNTATPPPEALPGTQPVTVSQWVADAEKQEGPMSPAVLVRRRPRTPTPPFALLHASYWQLSLDASSDGDH